MQLLNLLSFFFDQFKNFKEKNPQHDYNIYEKIT